ncbi:hypothetical protein KAW50_02635 [candidate division WOR-3 bacterium]|nr:hypothetical protein [candidate division WOR-3 bacterium]
MIILTKLNDPIRTIKGGFIKDLAGTENLSYKSALISICEMYRPQLPGSGQQLKAYDLGIRIQKAKDNLELSEEELQILKDFVKNSQIFFAVIIGRLNEYLEKFETKTK